MVDRGKVCYNMSMIELLSFEGMPLGDSKYVRVDGVEFSVARRDGYVELTFDDGTTTHMGDNGAIDTDFGDGSYVIYDPNRNFYAAGKHVPDHDLGIPLGRPSETE